MKRILLIDDDRFLANVCREKFKEAGYLVAVAHDGRAAIEALGLHRPDVIVLDLGLPEIDGLGVLRFVRSEATLSSLPVIVISNSDYFSGIVQAAWQAGATYFFNKGDCSPVSLVEAVREATLPANLPPVPDIPPPRPGPPPLPPFPASVPILPRSGLPRYSSRPVRVLVADDDRLIVGVLTFFLTQAGFVVTSASNGREALEQAQAEAPDLMVLDGVMPEMDGFEVLKHWRRIPRLAPIPIIMLTAETDEGKKTSALGNGALGYLTKPFSPDDLVKRVRFLTEQGG